MVISYSHILYWILEKLNKLRSIVNELEENLNEKKRKFKYEIRLDNELN